MIMISNEIFSAAHVLEIKQASVGFSTFVLHLSFSQCVRVFNSVDASWQNCKKKKKMCSAPKHDFAKQQTPSITT